MNKDFYYLQITNVTAEELPKGCTESLIYSINTSWLKHRKNPYHLHNEFSKSLYLGGQNCFIGMEVSLLKRLLGEPDEIKDRQLIYKLCNNSINKCSDAEIEEHRRERTKNPSDVNNTYSHWLRRDVIFTYENEVVIAVK